HAEVQRSSGAADDVTAQDEVTPVVAATDQTAVGHATSVSVFDHHVGGAGDRSGEGDTAGLDRLDRLAGEGVVLDPAVARAPSACGLAERIAHGCIDRRRPA